MKRNMVAGAIDEDFPLISSAKIVSVHLSFSSAPASQDATVTLEDGDGDPIRRDKYDVSESGDTEVTAVYLGWTVEKSGNLNVSLPNTGNLCTKVIAVYEYQQNV